MTLPLEQLSSFDTTRSVLERAEVAKAEFKVDVLSAVTAEKLRVLTYLQGRNPDEFRVANEKGLCPDLCAREPESDLVSYQTFRVNAFVRQYARSWTISQEPPAE